MNLYKLHSNPERLIGYDVAFEQVPELAWKKYFGINIEELKKREHLWKQSAECAYSYAYQIIKGRFLEGEATIATSAQWSYWYAVDIIKGRFPEGENVIATDPVELTYYKEFLKNL